MNQGMGMRSLLLLLVAMAVLPALVMAVLNYREDRRLAAEAVRQELAAVAQVAQAGQEAVVGGVRNMLETVASGPSVRRTDLRDLCYEFLGNIVRQSADFANLGFANRDGVVECMGRRSSARVEVRDRDYFNKVMATPRFTVGSFMLGRVSRTPALGFGMPVYDDKAQLVGVAFAAVDVRRLAHAFDQLDLRPDLHVTLLDRHGTMLATTRRDGLELGQPLPEGALRQALADSQRAPSSLQTRESGVGTWLHEIRPISVGDSGSLMLVVSTRLDLRLASALDRLQRQLLVLAAALATVLVVAWQLSVRVLARPIFRLRQRMQQAATGQPVPPTGTPPLTRELGELEQGFDDMVRQLQDGRAQLSRAQVLAGIGFYRIDLDQGQLHLDATLTSLLQRPAHALEMPLSEFDAMVHPEDIQRLLTNRQRLRQSGGEGRIQFRIRRADGDIRWLESFSLARAGDEGSHQMMGALQDVTASVRLQRLYALLNAINESTFGSDTAGGLFRTLCRVAVEVGGFRMAWVGQVMEQTGQDTPLILPLTSAGHDAGYTQSIATDPAGFVRTRLVAVQALTSGGLSVIDDLTRMEPTDAWVEAGIERGYRAAAGIPVRQGSRIVAVMVFMSDEPHRFDGTERELLVSLGRSMSRALDFIETEHQRQLALQAARTNEARLARAQQLARLGHWVRHAKDRSAEWSDGLFEIIGRDPAQGAPSLEETLATVHPDDVDAYRTAMDEALAGRGERTFRYRCRRSDGSLRWYEENIDAPVRDEHGQVVSVGGTVQDITDRMESEARLQLQLSSTELLNQIARATEERHDLLSVYRVVCEKLDTRFAVDLSLFLERQGQGLRVRVVHVGPQGGDAAQQALLQHGTEIEAGRNGLARCLGGVLVHEPDTAALDFELSRRLVAAGLRSVVLVPIQATGSVFGVLLVARRHAGAFVSSECEFLRQVGEHVTLAAGQSRLLASLQQAYDDLREAQQAALQQERLRVLGQMASGIAHDINNAISPVALYTESLLAREQGLSEQGRQQLATIQLAVDDVADTVARMREFYRPRTGQAERRRVDMNRLVGQAIGLTRARWRDQPQEQGLHFDVQTELVDPCPPVLAVEGEVRDALVNLVLNAVDALPGGGRVTVSTRRVAAEGGVDQLEVSVVDTGVGMDEETRRRCMEPFFTTKGERGSGLGLAMVFGCAQRHDASMEIDSAPGRGTCVRLRFPLAPAQAMDAASGLLLAEDETPRPALEVLLVDDDPLLLESVAEVLTQAGHRVTPAEGGAAGIRLFEAALATQPFQAVITDLGMPDVDGRQVARRVRELSPATPVIMLTGWGRRMQEDADLPAGVDILLPKPPRRHQLLDALQRLSAGGPRPAP